MKTVVCIDNGIIKDYTSQCRPELTVGQKYNVIEIKQEGGLYILDGVDMPRNIYGYAYKRFMDAEEYYKLHPELPYPIY